MSIVANVADCLVALLTTDAEAAAAEVGLIQRRRKVTGPWLAQTWVLGWLANANESLSGLVCMAATVGLVISPQGLAKRATRQGAAFLKRLLEKATQYAVCAEPAVRPVLERFTVVRILDSSVIRLPDGLKGIWSGCQGAALKASVSWDLRSGRLDLELRAGREHDRSSPAQTERVAKGGLRLADLGYYTLAVLNSLASEGAYFLSRVPTSAVMRGPDGKTHSLAGLLERSHEATVDLPIHLGARKALPCRLMATTVPANVADERRKRLHDEARRRQRPVSAAALQLAGWTVMVTNVPANMLTVVEALALLRVRWQIELLFKLWKSECLIDSWRSDDQWAVLCELYAKLIAVVINNWLIVMTVWDRPNPSLTIATRTIRKFVIVVAHALASGRRCRLIDILQLIQRTLSNSARVQSRRASPSTHQRLAAACGPP